MITKPRQPSRAQGYVPQNRGPHQALTTSVAPLRPKMNPAKDIREQVPPINQQRTVPSTPVPFTMEDLNINENSLREPYRRRMKEMKRAIHWGQRKLLLSEIEFFTLYWDPNVIPRPLCVYAGSAPGIHISLLSKMFPVFTFHLYDPKPFKIVNSERITIFNEYFTDEVAARYGNRDDVFFVSDIRTIGYKEVMDEELEKRGVLKTLVERGIKYFNPDASNIPSDLIGLYKQASNATTDRIETQIWKDMEIQQEWVLNMNPAHAFIKFRLPYVYEGDRFVQYLKGSVFWQTWAPQSSTETRLKPTKNANGVYELADWSILEYEEWNFYHNSTIRETVSYLNPFTNTAKPISEPELSNDYDSTSEAYILMLYYQKIGINNLDLIYPKVIKLSELITRSLNPGLESNNPDYKTLAKKRAVTSKIFVRSHDSFKAKVQISKPPPSKSVPSQPFQFTNIQLSSIPPSSSKPSLNLAPPTVPSLNLAPSTVPSLNLAPTVPSLNLAPSTVPSLNLTPPTVPSLNLAPYRSITQFGTLYRSITQFGTLYRPITQFSTPYRSINQFGTLSEWTGSIGFNPA